MAASRKRRKGRGKPKIQPDDPPSPEKIDPGEPPPTEIVFSFKYLHPDPPVSQAFPEGYLDEFLKCLQAVSGRKKGEVVGSRNPGFRAHGISWEKSNYPQGFDHLPTHLRDVAGFQLSLRREIYGRIIGFLVGNTFYVCWLDPNHETMGETNR